MNVTIYNVETLLDNGQLGVHMSSGRVWRVRRNGRTQTWKTRPDEFRIPVKCGLRGTFAITDHMFNEDGTARADTLTVM